MKYVFMALIGVLALGGCGTPPKPVTVAPDIETKMLQKVAIEFDRDFRLQASGLAPQMPPSYTRAEITGPYQDTHEFTYGTMYCIRANVPGLVGTGASGLVLLTPSAKGNPDSFDFKLIRQLGYKPISGCRETDYRAFPELIAVRENRRKNFDLEAETKAAADQPKRSGRPDRL
jgi:hypothetical protein